MIDYNVPFYSNTPDDTHCFQAALKMVLKYFLPEKEYSWEELEKKTAKVEGLWTWTMAGILWLKESCFDVVNIEQMDYRRFASEGESYLIEFFGEDVGKEQIEHSDIPQEVEYARRFADISELRIPYDSEIKSFLEQGYLVICNVNSHMLNDKEGYAGHFVVVKGYDDTGFILHDPGLPAFEKRHVRFDVFERAWAYPNETAKNIVAVRLKQ